MTANQEPQTESAPAARTRPFWAAGLGALGFTLVSVAAFSVWAWGGGWFRGRGGEPAMYAAVAVVFLGLTGLVLHPLVTGARRVARFYGVFLPAFLAYAAVWSAIWFALPHRAGEWLAALAGALVFVALTAWRFGRRSGWLPAAAVFFVLHTAGYFAGGQGMGRLLQAARNDGPGGLTPEQWLVLAKLAWGVGYGLGFGAGLGWVYAHLQRPAPASRPPEPGA
jgi:hypothetical protein